MVHNSDIKSVTISLSGPLKESITLEFFNILATAKRSDIWGKIELNESFLTDSPEYAKIVNSLNTRLHEEVKALLNTSFPGAITNIEIGTRFNAQIITGTDLLTHDESEFILRHAKFFPPSITDTQYSEAVAIHAGHFINRIDNASRQKKFRNNKVNKRERQVAWYIPADLHRQLENTAAQKRKTIAQCAIEALHKGLPGK